MQRYRRYGEMLIETAIRAVAFLSITVIALIFLFIGREALGVFSAAESSIHAESSNIAAEVYNPEESSESTPAPTAAEQTPQETAPSSLWANLLGSTWQPVSRQPKYGILPLVVGTLKIALIAVALAAPLAILAALYTAFFAPKWMQELIKPVVELLAGFPSVVIGFFCLMVVASAVQEALGTTYRLNALVGGIGVAIAILPVIFTISEDTFAALPRRLWEAGLALGARPWEVAFRIMLPAAIPGVFAAVLLGLGRAVGETMIVLMATGNAPLLSWSVLAPARTLSATIGAEMGEVVWGSLHYHVLFLLGFLLFVATLTLNATAELWVRRRLLQRFRGMSS
jgi:phosphate transport system permease protein